MAESTVKINLNVDSKSGQAAIQRTSTQLKDLGRTSTTSSTAISAGMKTANTQVKALGKNAMTSGAAMKKSSDVMKTGMKTASAQTKTLGKDLQKTSKYIKDVGKDATKSGTSVSSGMKNAVTGVKTLGTSADKTSKQIKSIGVSAATSGASIQRTSTLLKGLSVAAVASGAAMGTGTKLGATGMILLGAAAAKTNSVMIQLTKSQAMGIPKIGEYIDEVKELIIVEKNATETMGKGTLHLEKQLKVLDKLGKEYIEYTGHVNKSIDATRKSTTEIKKNTTATKKNSKALKSTIGVVKKYKTALLALAAVAFTAVVVSGATFERNMATVSGVMRATAEQSKALADAAKKYGKDSEWGANKAADALKFMGMAGYTAGQAIDALPNLLKLATAAGLDLATVSDIVTDSLTAMGMGVNDLERFNDVLIGTTTRSNTNIQMLGESLKYVAPVASQMGYDIEQLSAMLGTLANSGIKASDAGTDLRQAMIKNVSVAKKFGKAENDLIGTLEAATEAGWGVTEVTKNYGLIAAKSVLVLMKQIDGYKKLDVELRNVKGETEKLSAIKLDTLIGDFNLFKSAAMGLGLTIYEWIDGPLRVALQTATYLTNALNTLFTTTPTAQETVLSRLSQEIVVIEGEIVKLKNLTENKIFFFGEDIQELNEKEAQLIRLKKLYEAFSVDVPKPKVGGEDGAEEIGPASAAGIAKAEDWFSNWQRMEKENQKNIIKIKHSGYQQAVSLLMLEKQDMIDKYGDQEAIHEHFKLRQGVLDKAEDKRKLQADIDEAKRKASNHEKILTYISTESENKKRAIAQETAMIGDLIRKQQEAGVISGEEATKLKDAALIVGQEKLNADKIAGQKAFYDEYNNLGMSSFDLERQQLLDSAAAWEAYGISKIDIATMVEAQLGDIRKREFQQQVAGIQQTAGVMADGFKMLSDMGGKHSKKAFLAYKAFKITETLISTYSGAMKAYDSLASIPYVGHALGLAAAAAVTGFGMAKVAMISSQQPPSYDQGGVSNAGGIYQTGNIAEAHIPIPSGGKIPVQMGEKEKEPAPQEINIMNVMNPAMFDEYLASAEGQDAILNVIGNRSQSVKRYLR